MCSQSSVDSVVQGRRQIKWVRVIARPVSHVTWPHTHASPPHLVRWPPPSMMESLAGAGSSLICPFLTMQFTDRHRLSDPYTRQIVPFPPLPWPPIPHCPVPWPSISQPFGSRTHWTLQWGIEILHTAPVERNFPNVARKLVYLFYVRELFLINQIANWLIVSGPHTTYVSIPLTNISFSILYLVCQKHLNSWIFPQ